MLEKNNSARPTARLKNLRFGKRLPGISRKYKYGVCVFKSAFPVFPGNINTAFAFSRAPSRYFPEI
jgi:hypothetical protein